MKEKNFIRFILPSEPFLISLLIIFIVVFLFGDSSPYPQNNLQYLINLLYTSQAFAYLGVFSISALISRCFFCFGVMSTFEEFIKDVIRKSKGWPIKEESIALESLFYSGINFAELYNFCNFINEVSFIAFTNNEESPLEYKIFARQEEEGYWLFYSINSQDEKRIKTLQMIVGHFTEVLTGEKAYLREIKEQAKTDHYLQDVEIEKLLIGVISKEKAKTIKKICDKYHKMILEKKLEEKGF